MTNNKGLLIILSAPSGCGKDTVFKAIKDLRNDVVESISATTRKPRDGEVEGVNYYFKSESDFQLMVVNDELLEYARYNNCYYGTPVSEVEKAINDGKICFLIIDVQGAQSILKVRPDAISIFLLPPSLDVLEKRLINRSTNDSEDVKNRMKIAQREIDMAPLYKYIVVNDDLNECVNKINDIINKELLTLNSKEIK
ncbi:guanylate kinase [uncultured Eubacterium sp.]|uniref:guanylate kinase n=1 Tax=uncultured Eubacterium sp. TaxID=165185 RepID=UPI0025D7767F|nr:guanylate kinase [uncultured Eubacterium sp.]